MVKSVNTLTIKDYSLFNRTGKKSYLMYLPIPFLFNKKLNLLITEVERGLINESSYNKFINTEFHLLKLAYRIEYLSALYQGLYNGMVNVGKLNDLNNIIGKEVETNVKQYIEKVSRETGIVVKSANDLIKLAKKIEWLSDKYIERLKQQPQDTGLTFNQIVIIVFSTTNIPINYDMSMADFFELKEQAEKAGKKTENGKH